MSAPVSSRVGTGAAPQSKLSNVEDSTFVRHSVSDIKFGEIGGDDLARCLKSENVSGITSSKLPDHHSEVNQELEKANASDCDSEQRCSSSAIDLPLEENQNEEGDCAVSSNGMPAADDTASDFKELKTSDSTFVTNCSSDDECSFPESKEAGIVDSIGVSTSEVTDMNQDAFVTSQAPQLFSPDQSDPLTTVETNLVASLEDGQILEVIHESDIAKQVEDCKNTDKDRSQEQVSEAQIMTALGERKEGESKERFRERLWCYLFENLNRSVDELYLLCELECDMEQVREAILVLEEAASDFKELNCRVKEFENSKKKASPLADVAPMTMKSDHRRPHALSWEVRRMTTSPHRADILSSSLEAFKKVQEEREKTHAISDRSTKDSQRSGRKLLNVGSTADVDSEAKPRKQSVVSDPARTSMERHKKSSVSTRPSRLSSAPNNRLASQGSSSNNVNVPRLPTRGTSTALVAGKSKREQSISTVEREKNSISVDERGIQNAVNGKRREKENEKERKNSVSWKSMDAWKEKRNWEEILASPCRYSSRASHAPSVTRKGTERARTLHDKLMSPDKKKKTALDLKREAEEKHARAMRIKRDFENERVQKFQRTSEKLNRVTEWQAVRSSKLKEGMYARHRSSETRHEAHLAQVVKRAGDESIKVNEVRFITSLNEENKKFMLHQKLHGSEMRRAEKLQVLRAKQKEDMAREEAALERRKLLEAEKQQRLAETQRKKEEAQVRKEEERKASSAAREAKALDQLRRKEERAKAQQEEAELLAQKLAERLRESEQRRKFYLEQIRERASMDFRDHSSPLMRRPLSKDGQGRLAAVCVGEDNHVNNALSSGDSHLAAIDAGPHHILKRRIKKIRQRLMSLKHEYSEPAIAENSGIGYRTAMTAASARLGRWLQDLQRHRQKRKEGASSIGLTTAEMIKFLEGKELELQASRQAGLLDFISSALPASHISKPEACQVTIYLLRLLKVLLSVPTNRSYFLSQNLLPPVIPMLSAALEKYIKIAASLNSSSSSLPTSKMSVNFDSISEVLDGFLWTVTVIIGHESSDERHIQMQDGLLELVVAYQIIHRLRDLFALHDRPQIEGSPFPSSILLSVNLLVALTSKSRTLSSIDWESFPHRLHRSENILPNAAESTANADSVINGIPKEHRFPSLAPNDCLTGLHYVLEGEKCKAEGFNDLESGGAECQKEEQGSNSTLSRNINLGATPILDESEKTFSSVTCRSSSVQEVDNNSVDIVVKLKDKNSPRLKEPQGFLLAAISETGLVSLLSLLTAVLLQANTRTSEQPAYVLPSNFEEVAIGVLKVLNNLAAMDITFLQYMLAKSDLKMEFFHIMSFLLTHCTGKWKSASDQVGFLLLESLLLISYFSLLHPGNQAVLRWGKGTNILHKMCDLPFVFFSDPDLMPVLGGTLVGACFGCEQNKGVVQSELSTEMLLTLITSCKNTPQPPLESASSTENPPTQASSQSIHLTPEEPSRKLHSNQAHKPSRVAPKTTSRSSSARTTAVLGGTTRGGRPRSTKECKVINRASVTASAPMLHTRFPGSFIDRVEKFFSAETEEENS